MMMMVMVMMTDPAFDDTETTTGRVMGIWRGYDEIGKII